MTQNNYVNLFNLLCIGVYVSTHLGKETKQYAGRILAKEMFQFIHTRFQTSINMSGFTTKNMCTAQWFKVAHV